RAGAHVVAAGRRLAPLEAVAGEARALGPRALAMGCDARDARAVDTGGAGGRPAPLGAVGGGARALGRRALAMGCDVRDAAQVDTVVVETMREFGRIDLLVNNAGYRIRAPLADLPRDEWDAMAGINLPGVFLCCQSVGRVMIGQRAGKIINITSVAGRTGSRGMAAYAAAQAGVTALTQSLGAEWAKHGITVNAVAPGPTETEGVLEVWKTPAMIAQAAREVPLQRLGRPEEVAWAVVFLASDRADFITGETLYVSGGPRVSNREDCTARGAGARVAGAS